MSGPPIEGIPVSDQGAAGLAIAGSLACRRCGYNLRTLSTAGVCPECGTPVEHALGGYLLKYASPIWLRRVARGSLLLIITIGVTVLGGIAAGLWGFALVLSTGFARGTLPFAGANMRQTMLVSGLAYTPVHVLMIASVLLLTARNPAAAQPDQDSRTRVWLRYSLWAYVASALLGWITAFTPDALMSISTRSMLGAIAGPVGLAVFTLMAVLAVRYFAELMQRVPRPGPVKLAKVCFWGLLVCGVLMTFGQALSIGTTAQTLTAMQTPTSAPSGTYTYTVSSSGSVVPPSPARPSPVAGQPATTAPFAPPGINLPRTPPGFMLAQGLTGCAGCAGFGFYIAGFVLLVMVCSTLYGVAREAEQIAAVPPAESG